MALQTIPYRMHFDPPPTKTNKVPWSVPSPPFARRPPPQHAMDQVASGLCELRARCDVRAFRICEHNGPKNTQILSLICLRGKQQCGARRSRSVWVWSA